MARLHCSPGNQPIGIAHASVRLKRMDISAAGTAKASYRTREIRQSGIIGGLGKRGHGGILNPPRNQKDETGNPPPESRRA